ncbi:arsenic resistance N-acetyltransferase ArsN2 [Cytophagaceae bacterium ABcell3]|nr:arsenic resistance N-acetyltransferase ArsN2 [Cytophagaceae bacterium ABcell3]
MKRNSIVFRVCHQNFFEEWHDLKLLLQECNLPEDVDFSRSTFAIAKENKNLIGAAGMEVYGKYGLLRSVVVSEQYRFGKIGRLLCETVFQTAGDKGVVEFFLLTTDASSYFKKLGFVVVDRSLVPSAIRRSEQFSRSCPATAICMHKIYV